MVPRKYKASTWFLLSQAKPAVVNGNYLPFSDECRSGESCFSVSKLDNSRV
jgi:hypothetical protein